MVAAAFEASHRSDHLFISVVKTLIDAKANLEAKDKVNLILQIFNSNHL